MKKEISRYNLINKNYEMEKIVKLFQISIKRTNRNVKEKSLRKIFRDYIPRFTGLRANNYFVYKVYVQYQKLDRVSRTFIDNEYFAKIDKSWKLQYSESTFYRLKNKAVAEFLDGIL